MNRMNRRAVLRGLAGTTIALPWLEAMNMQKANAAPGVSDTGFPKRFIVWVTCNGFHPPIWNPTGGETDFVLRPVHKALEPFKKDLVMVAGLNDAAFGMGGGDLHSRGMCTFLSGIESVVNTAVGSFGGESKASGGITLDQQIVKSLAPKTKFPSLEMNFLQGGGAYGTTSYLDASKPLPGSKDPSAVFNRLFAGGTGGGAVGDPAAAARIQVEKRSILDGVGRTYQGLLPRLGLADKDKVESHLSQIRDLEMRLQTAAAPAAASPAGGGVSGCPKTATAPTGSDRPAQAAAFVDLLATAIACDLTRVSSMQWDFTTGNSVYSWVGVSRGHHDMSHDGDERTDTIAELTKIHVFYNDQLARLVTRLKAIPEGPGTAFDNTIILHATDLGRGNNGHTGTNKFHMLMGHGGGALKNTGRLLRYSGDANNKLFVSILNMFDIPMTSFGKPGLSSGPLAGL